MKELKKNYSEEFREFDKKYKTDEDEADLPINKLSEAERKQIERDEKVRRLHAMLDSKYGKNRYKIPQGRRCPETVEEEAAIGEIERKTMAA